MTISYTILEPSRLALFQFGTNIETTEAIRVFERYVQDSRFDPMDRMLSDARRLRSVRTSYRAILNGVLSLRRSLSLFREPVDSVIVVNSNIAYGVGRLLEQVQNPLSEIHITVSRDEAEALEKVGQPETNLEALYGRIKAFGAGWETLGDHEA